MILLFQLLRTARQVHPDPGWWDRLSRVKYCARGLLLPRLTRKWFDILDTSKLAVIGRNHPHIFSKLQRSYLDRSPGPWSRLQALKNHYRFVTLRLSDDSVHRIYGSSGLVLTRIPLAGAGSIELRLSYYDSLSKEGEMCLAVHDGDTGGLLATLSFCVTRYEASRTEVFVGGLQGFTSPSQKERIITITRSLHGLRPKALLLFALQQLAAVWHLDSIRAVSDSQHVYRHYRKRKKVAMSYDEFWLESGGQPGADGLFALPTTAAPRDLTGMKPSKRQMYRRRYVMLQDLAEQIRHSVARHTLPAKTPSPRQAILDPRFRVGTVPMLDPMHFQSRPR